MKNDYHLLIKGIEEFNRREFFESHETLEDYWRTLSGNEKELVQSIIQAAVAYYHYGRGNRVGARKLLLRAIARAKSVPVGTCNLDTEPYLETILLSLQTVESGDPEMTMQIPVIQFKQD